MPRVVRRPPVFTPEVVELPDGWPACRVGRCGSTIAVARIDAPLGPVVIACENGHFRKHARKDDFRRGGRYAGAFSAAAVAPDVPPGAPERRVEPGERRRAEVLEDAERCALCGTPPAEHPYRPDLAVRSDREVWLWLRRWRPEVFAQLVEAAAIVGRRETVGAGSWRLAIAPSVRERIVEALRTSMLATVHVVPPALLEPLAGVLSPRELDFAVNRLLIAVCRTCAEQRAGTVMTGEAYMRDYIAGVHGGDVRVARADGAGWAMMETLATQAVRLQRATARRPA